jgi:ferredoxin-2, mitochondrial
MLPTHARATFVGLHPAPRGYSRTAQVETTTVETSQTSLTSSASNTSESAVSDSTELPEVKTVPITFVESDGRKKTVPAQIGKHLLDVAHDNKVDLEGACGGELSCSTCHLIFEPHVYATLPPKTDEEQDMLDLAYAVTETCVLTLVLLFKKVIECLIKFVSMFFFCRSRLGCQVRVTEALAGMKVQIPDDGF